MVSTYIKRQANLSKLKNKQEIVLCMILDEETYRNLNSIYFFRKLKKKDKLIKYGAKMGIYENLNFSVLVGVVFIFQFLELYEVTRYIETFNLFTISSFIGMQLIEEDIVNRLNVFI